MVEQPEPIHSDQHRSRWNITLIFALAVAVLGVVNMAGGGGGELLILLGLAMAAFSWLTTPRAYFIYRDALVIAYGTPRTKAIPFAEISHLELLALPIGERLRLRLLSGRREMLIPRDNAAFQQHLERALSDYSAQQGGSFVEGTLTPGRGTPGDGTGDAATIAGAGAAAADAAIDPATGTGGDATPAPFDAEPTYGAPSGAAPVSRDAPILEFEDDAPSAAPPPPAESSSPPDDANARPPSPY